MLLFSMAAPNKCNLEWLYMKPHMHHRADRDLGHDAATLGPEAVSDGQVAR